MGLVISRMKSLKWWLYPTFPRHVVEEWNNGKYKVHMYDDEKNIRGYAELTANPIDYFTPEIVIWMLVWGLVAQILIGVLSLYPCIPPTITIAAISPILAYIVYIALYKIPKTKIKHTIIIHDIKHLREQLLSYDDALASCFEKVECYKKVLDRNPLEEPT